MDKMCRARFLTYVCYINNRMLWACHEMRMYILCTAAFCLNWLWHGNQFSEDQLYRKDMFPLRYIENAYKNTTTMPKVLK